MQNIKGIIMCYNMLLERLEKTEEIDILLFKIAHGTKRYNFLTGFVFATCHET